MKSYTNLRNLTSSLINSTDTTVLTLVDQYINDGYRLVLGKQAWWFLNKSKTISTVASQQFYELPADFGQLDDVTVTLATSKYTPKECPSRIMWDKLNQNTQVTSNIPDYYFIFGGQLGFYPIPSSTTSNAITFNYKQKVRDLSIADYSAGTIVSIAASGTAIVGSGTVFTASMVGRFIRITESDTANKGDGFWYEIGSYTSGTSIGLLKPYNGTAIAAGAANYTIGQMPILPEPYHVLPVYYAAWQYWEQQNDLQRATTYQNNYNTMLKQMEEDAGSKSESMVLDDGFDYDMINPNLTVTLP